MSAACICSAVGLRAVVSVRVRARANTSSLRAHSMRLTARWAVTLVAAYALPALEARAAGALAVSSARAVFADRMAGGAAHKRRPPIRLSPGLAHRPWLEQLAGERGASHCAPLQPWPWHQSPADEIEGVRVSLWHSAAGAIPAVEALALARRHARAVARAPALALRLGAVVTAPSVRARALARRRAVASSSTRTQDFDVLRPQLADSFPKPSNQRFSAVHPPSTKHVAVPPSRTKVLRSILHTL
jgi:hypothetical protein